MKKEIYLVQSCPKDEFRKAAKNGYKCRMMLYRCNCSPVWATASRREAIADCVKHNKMKIIECMFFMLPIHLFK